MTEKTNLPGEPPEPREAERSEAEVRQAWMRD